MKPSDSRNILFPLNCDSKTDRVQCLQATNNE